MFDKKRTIHFLAISFLISWASALVIYFNGGLVASPVIIPEANLTLAFLLLGSVYMWGPAIAHILTRLITKEGWASAILKPDLKGEWRFWLMAWLLTPLLIIIGAGVYFVFFPGYFDPTLSILKQQMALSIPSIGEIDIIQIVLVQTAAAIFLAPILNLVSTFGEEFGWRAYLLQKLLPLGEKKALVLQGVIWGVWHWPVIAMGYNFGFEYPSFPWLGMLAMVWFTVLVGVFFGWLVLRAKSVWPAVIGHGALNGLAAISIYFTRGNPSPLLGPLPIGLIGSLPFLLVAIWILFIQKEAIKA